ncbi:MAG: hypothetical protein LUI07_03620, partial [Lachnospiraceae bacterium]|nr:hypothetical protein [Lachnospiraceae bacterium]
PRLLSVAIRVLGGARCPGYFVTVPYFVTGHTLTNSRYFNRYRCGQYPYFILSIIRLFTFVRLSRRLYRFYLPF